MNSVLQGADWLARRVSGKTAVHATRWMGISRRWTWCSRAVEIAGPDVNSRGVRVFHREYRTVSAGIGVPLLHSLQMVPYATPEG